MVGEGMGTRIIPQAKDRSTAFWWDVYDTMENIMEHLAGRAAVEGLSKEHLLEFNENVPNGWGNRVIFEIVTVINRENILKRICNSETCGNFRSFFILLAIHFIN